MKGSFPLWFNTCAWKAVNAFMWATCRYSYLWFSSLFYWYSLILESLCDTPEFEWKRKLAWEVLHLVANTIIKQAMSVFKKATQVESGQLRFDLSRIHLSIISRCSWDNIFSLSVINILIINRAAAKRQGPLCLSWFHKKCSHDSNHLTILRF